MESLNAKKIDLKFMIDPLFDKMAASLDEVGARGLLLNQLYVLHDCELVFDYVDTINKSPGTASVEHSCDITELQGTYYLIFYCLSSA